MGFSRDTPALVPKILGADVELGNFIDGIDLLSGTGRLASRLLLREIEGVPAGARDDASWRAWNRTTARDWWGGHEGPDGESGRRFLAEHGGSAYIDLDHLELALPETLSARDHVAYWRAMLALVGQAVTRVNGHLPAERRVHALANCSDGYGHSYGAHTNVLVSRVAWDNIMRRKPHYLAFLAAFQASGIVFTGAGKVGSENGRTPVGYQLSQRADFLETLLGEQTTYFRPIVNSRHEPLCGRPAAIETTGSTLARLHVIFFDATLCQVATFLRVGTLQIIVAMLEAECVPPQLCLDDALDAVVRWSHDPTLEARARLVTGEEVTAVELQRRFLEEATAFAGACGLEPFVPMASDILSLWGDTLTKLQARDFLSLARRLDWVLKQRMLEGVMAVRPGLDWRSPQIKHLDQLYASVDEDEGLFWPYERAGLVERVVNEDEVLRAQQEPPVDTRAWTRAHLLRAAGAARIKEVDWDLVEIGSDRVEHGSAWPASTTVHLSSPFGGTKAENQTLFSGDRPLDEIVSALAPPREASPQLWRPSGSQRAVY